VPSHPPELRPYRTAVYVITAALCAAFGYALIGSIVRDVFGQRAPDGTQRASTDVACVEDVDRLFSLLAARAVQPAPGGLRGDSSALEWDRWSRRWEDDVAEVSVRCRLETPTDETRRHLAIALDGMENLRRDLDRSGAEAASEVRRVRDALGSARGTMKPK
jgi:hypothetical protein